MGIQRALIGILLSYPIICFAQTPLASRVSTSRPGQTLSSTQTSARNQETAALFAPVFYQALGDKPRFDYITNFDFDGDWRGDNNWDNSENIRFPLKAYVYYSVSETSSHIFIHYAVFHPRDYKGGDLKGAILSELMREGIRRGGKYDPTGLADEATLAHENDLEGCLLVVAKNGSELKQARVVFVETFRHNGFSKYVSGDAAAPGFETIRIDGQSVLLYVEPKGHGIEAYNGGEKQTAKKKFIIYTFGGKAEQPKEGHEGRFGYDLVPIQSTLWSRARTRTSNHRNDGINATYGAAHEYGKLTVNMIQPNGKAAGMRVDVGKAGSAFRGKVGGANMAKPPWAWTEGNSSRESLGVWFFDPAQVVKRDFKLDESFPTTYVRLPFWAAGAVALPKKLAAD